MNIWKINNIKILRKNSNIKVQTNFFKLNFKYMKNLRKNYLKLRQTAIIKRIN